MRTGEAMKYTDVQNTLVLSILYLSFFSTQAHRCSVALNDFHSEGLCSRSGTMTALRNITSGLSDAPEFGKDENGSLRKRMLSMNVLTLVSMRFTVFSRAWVVCWSETAPNIACLVRYVNPA